MRSQRSKPVLLCLCVAAAGPLAFAQSSIGIVSTEGAHVQGVVSISGGKATLQNNGTVTAGAQASEVSLSRGGAVKVCAGSTVSFSQSATPRMASPMSRNPLLVALQRGATEIQTGVQRSDSIVTPDLRVEMSDNATLDLRVRVNSNGDTCVENLGKNAPMLHVTEQFSGAGYLVKPGQRVLFEHGSVREVVDRESTNCGCPKGGKGSKDDFPEAVSAGLVQPDVPAVAPGDTHVQVAAGFDYNGATGTATGPPAPGNNAPSVTTRSDTAAAAAPSAPAKAKPEEHESSNPFRAIGRFFRRLFGGS